MDFGKIRARLFPVGVQRLVTAVIQRLTRIKAGDFKITVEDIAAGGEDQRVGPDFLPDNPLIHQVGDPRRSRFLMVFHRQIVAFTLNQGIN